MPKVGGRRVMVLLFRKKHVVKNKVMKCNNKMAQEHSFLKKENAHKNAKI